MACRQLRRATSPSTLRVNAVVKRKPSALVIQSSVNTWWPRLASKNHRVANAAAEAIMKAGSSSVDHHIRPNQMPPKLCSREGRKKTLRKRRATCRLPRDHRWRCFQSPTTLPAGSSARQWALPYD